MKTIPCSEVMRRSSSRNRPGPGEASFAEHRFDDDAGDAVGRDDASVKLFAALRARLGRNAVVIVGNGAW